MPLVRHNLVSDTQLAEMFGPHVPQLASLANKLVLYDGTVEMHKPPPSDVIHAGLLRRLFIMAYADIDAVLLCAANRLADVPRLDRLQTRTEIESWAQKSISVYLPLFEMLGLWTHRHDLGNVSLNMLDPVLFKEFEGHVNVYYEQNVRLFDRIEYELNGLMHDSQLDNAQVILHEITPASLHRRMTELRRRGKTYSADELRALRVDVLVDSEADCYLALGLIHKRWTPAHRQGSFAEGRFLDYIAKPRYNGYRCLITTVLCEDIEAEINGKHRRQLVEFRIRTQEMDVINTYGIVAAMQHPDPIEQVWWEDAAITDAMTRRDGDADGSICVFSPTGQVIYPVKPDSTVLDIAFRIHTALGPYTRHCTVNGRKVNYGHRIKHHDLVMIEFDTQYPSVEEKWDDYCHAATTKDAIRRFIKQRDRSPHKGRQRIDKVLQRESMIYQMRFPEDKIAKSLTRIAHDLGCATVDGLYVKVLEGNIAPDKVVAAMIETELVEHIIRTDGKNWPGRRIRIAQSWMQEKGERKLDRAVRVMPGVEIVGRVEERRGEDILVVHRRDHHLAPTGELAIPLAWRPMTTERESAEIIITAPPRATIASKILAEVTKLGGDDVQQGITLHGFNLEMQDGAAHIKIIIDAPSFDAIHQFQDALRRLRDEKTITDFKIWQLYPGQRMLLSGKLDKRRQNPYTLKQIRDRSMFFGRDDEINRVIEEVQTLRPFIILYGQKRIGKTSLMVHLADYILPQTCDVIPVSYDVHGLTPFTPETFLLALADAARNRIQDERNTTRPENRAVTERSIPRLRPKHLQQDPYGTFAEWVHRVQERLKGTRLLFMVDEFTRAEEECARGHLDPAFFDGLQSLVDNHNIGLLLCVHDNIYNDHNSYSWGMMQRGSPIHLVSLEHEPAARLVRQPTERIYKFSDEIVERILHLTDCHPYFIHALSIEISAQMRTAKHDAVTPDDLEVAILKMLRNGDHYFSHYKSSVDEPTWDMLKTMALAVTPRNRWVSYDDIRATGQLGENISMGGRMSINSLYRARIITARTTFDDQVEYAIPVELLQIWLKKRTNPLITRDMQRED